MHALLPPPPPIHSTSSPSLQLPSMYNFFSQSQPSAAKPTKHAAAPSTNSSPQRFSCLYCPREYDTFQALGGHQKAHKLERAAARQEAKSTHHAAAQSTNSSPRRFTGPNCTREFATSKARAGHLKAHKHERATAAGPNIPANNLQECRLLNLFPTDPQQPQGVSTDEDDSANMDLTLRL